jgi:hypothetical protein
MAELSEEQVPKEFHSGKPLPSLRCWRCQCVTPKDLLRQRVVDTSSSRGTHVVTNDYVSVAGLYEIVNLCDACAEEFTTRKKAKLDARALRESWWGRLALGACFVGMLLLVRQPLPHSIALAWILDRLRMLGPAVLLMGVVFLGEYLMGLRPDRFHRRIRVPWMIIISGAILWGICHMHTVQRVLGWLGRKRSSTAAPSSFNSQNSLAAETREPRGEPPYEETPFPGVLEGVVDSDREKERGAQIVRLNNRQIR